MQSFVVGSRSIRLGSIAAIAATLVVLVGLASGCASSGGDAEGRSGPAGPSALHQGKSIGEIEIQLGLSLANDVASVATQYELAESLDSRLRSQLAPNISQDGSLQIRIEIIGMRVRSTNSAIWLGGAAGSDTITAQVEIFEDGQSIKMFTTSTSTSLGGFIWGGRGRRINRMLNDLSKRIVARI